MKDAEHRPSILDEADAHRELAILGDKLAGAVERVDRPEARRRGRQALGLDQLLGKDRNIGKGVAEHGDDDPLGAEIGLGHRGLVGFLANVEISRVDPHDRLAGRHRGAPRDFEQLIARFAHAAARRSAVRIACHSRSGVTGMSICSMPSGASASTIALTSAGGAPIAPASPAPFRPSGLVRHGTTL